MIVSTEGVSGIQEEQNQLAIQVLDEHGGDNALDTVTNGLGEEESKWVLENVIRLNGLVGVDFIGFEAKAMELFWEIDRSRREKELEESKQKS